MKAALKQIHRTTTASFLCEERQYSKTPFFWHYHPQFEILLVIRGRGRSFIADHIGEYRDGDLMLLGQNVPHTFCPDHHDPDDPPRQPHVVIQFDETITDNGLLKLPEMRAINDLLARSERGLSFTGSTRKEVADVIAAMPRMAPGPRLLALFDVLLRLAPHGKPLASPGFNPSLRQPLHRKIDVVCTRINAGFTSEINHTTMARLAAMGPQAFSRFFKRATGKTMTDYVNELRVGLACRLLVETEMNALKVCHRVGFNNFSNFVRQFRQRKSLSPAKFRKKHAKSVGVQS